MFSLFWSWLILRMSVFYLQVKWCMVLLNYLSKAEKNTTFLIVQSHHSVWYLSNFRYFPLHFSSWRNNFTISNQSQHCSEESFSTLLQREEAFMWSENTRLIFFSLPMKRCCSNSQSELSQFTSLSPITFTWVWMSLAAENLAL